MSETTLPEQWVTARLADVTQKIADRDHYTPTYVEAGVIMISPKDFDEEGRIDFTNCQFISQVEHERNRRKTDITAGDLVFTRIGARLGKACLVTPEMPEFSLLHSAVMIRTASHRVLPEYLLFILKGHELQSQIGREIQSIGVPDLGLDKINAFVVTLPPLPQQRKIARILTTVDNLIEKTEALIAKYQAIKHGMMHDLFTRGVDAHGHLRPPYEQVPELYKQSDLGWIPKEWEATDLGSLCDTASGGTPSRDVAAFWNGTIPWVKTGEVNYRVIVETEEQITQLGMAGSAARLLPKGTVIMALFGPGPTRGRVGILGIDATVNQACLAFLPSQKIATDYLYYALMWSYDDLRMLSNDGAQQNLNASLVRGFAIPVPDTSEQKRIALSVKTIEDSANAEHRHLDKLWESKTGLMQDLLTGKMRVKVGDTKEDNQ